MISLSSMTKAVVAVALMSSSTVTMAQRACQGTNCVLPLAAPPAPAPVYSAPAPAPAPVEIVPVEAVATSRGFNFLPLILGAALLAGALYFILRNNDDDDESPASP